MTGNQVNLITHFLPNVGIKLLSLQQLLHGLSPHINYQYDCNIFLPGRLRDTSSNYHVPEGGETDLQLPHFLFKGLLKAKIKFLNKSHRNCPLDNNPDIFDAETSHKII